jgi:hypothetical protein
MKKLNNTDFYQRLCGVSDLSKESAVKNNYSDDVFIDEAVRLISEIPRFFSDQLDRMTMWDRIGNGIGSAVSKSDGNFRLFINNLVDYVKADYSKFACSETIQNIINTFELREKEWQSLFVENCQKYSFLIIAKSRLYWQTKNNKSKTNNNFEEVENEDL